MNRRSQGYEPCEIPLLHPAIYVSFQHICTGSPQADCFLHLGQHPHILFILQNSGRRWSRTTRAVKQLVYSQHRYPYGIFSQNPDPRVSNDFFVLCFPLDCFMLCQSHRVVSDIIMPFGAILCFLKTPLSSMRACDGLLKLRNIYRTGNQIKHKPMPLHAFAHSDSHTLIRKFFLPIKRMGSIRKKWKF